MGLVRSFIGTDGIWQYIPHINTGLFSIIKVHFLLFANLIVDWHINTINFTDSGLIYFGGRFLVCGRSDIMCIPEYAAAYGEDGTKINRNPRKYNSIMIAKRKAL